MRTVANETDEERKVRITGLIGQVIARKREQEGRRYVTAADIFYDALGKEERTHELITAYAEDPTSCPDGVIIYCAQQLGLGSTRN